MGTELVTKTFERQCLAFQEKVDQVLATIDNVDDASNLLAKATAMQTYARRLQDGVKAERPIAISVLKIKGKVGQLSPREKGGRGNKSPTPAIGVFNPSVIAAYRKIGDYAKRLDGYYEASDDVPSQEGFFQYIASNGQISTKFTGEVEWYTPKEWIDLARKTMGSIDLDPASSPYAQKVVKAKKYYTEKDDGLSQDWAGNVWLNPPYKHPLASQFANKLCDEYESGNVSQGILLVNNVTDNGWFHRCASVGLAAFTLGRISFYNVEGDKANPTQGQTFFYFGRRLRKFETIFGERCLILRGVAA